ncbi:MAG: DEAD/DEAH box helicase, partial [Planctomycetota bacterium]|nr:DEAD/DEAH box helicase [Planctomycetota bacterium]
DSQTVDVTELLAAIRRGERTVALGDGTTGTLPEEWVRKHCSWLSLGEQARDQDGTAEIRFASSQACIIDLLLEQLPEATFDKAVAAARRRIAGFKHIEARPQPTGFTGTLRDYQTHGLGWLEFLKDFGLGGILADDMGLGKTIQLLAHIQDCRNRDRVKGRLPWLIVAPKSLVFNWAREAKRFTPALNVLEYTGAERHEAQDHIATADVVLTTYGALRTDATSLHERRWEAVVLDEAQAIKNGSSLGAKAARLVGASAKRRIAMTGTPIENSLADLWSIMEFPNPGMLGTASAFKEVSKLSSQAAAEEESSLVRRAVKPFILRRTKQVVAKELPARTEQTIRCELSGEQKTLYDSILKHYRESLLGTNGKVATQGVGKSRIHVLEALLRLRQAACHPDLIEPKDRPITKSKKTKAAPTPEAASSKLSTMMEMLDEILAERHSVLIFSQFTSLLAIVRSALDQRGIAHEYLDGQTPLKERAKAVDRFQKVDAKSPRVFVVSLKAGGVGLNLTAADYVFILDPWWNPAAESQAIDRAHRIGQTRSVMAYRFIAAGTVEDRIQELQASKRALATAIMGDDSPADGPLASLTKDELTWLLS